MKKLLGILAVIAVVGVLIVPRVMEVINKTEEVDAVSIIAVGGMQVLTGDLQAKVELIGTTSPEDLVNVMISMPAEVKEVKAFVGDYVNEGDVLFTMDTESIENQVTQAEIGLTMAEVGVANANAGVNQSRLGYNMAKSNYQMQIDSYNFGQSNLANYEVLLAEGVVSQMEYDQVKLQSSPETLGLLETQLEQASAGLSQARLGIESANASRKQAEEGFKTASEMLEDMSVTAPVSGFITASYVTENNFASNAQPTFVIQNIDTITVSASVTESLVSKIAIGDKVTVNIDALDEASFVGTIETLSSAADQRTLLFPMTVKVMNKDHAIKPGMFATVDVVKAESKDAIYVPAEAVILRDDVSYLYLLEGDNRAVRVIVEVGIDNGYFTEILTGATAEDIIITKGIGLIDESSTIKVIRSDQ